MISEVKKGHFYKDFISLHGQGIQRVLYGITFMLPIFCMPAKVYFPYRLTYSNSSTARLYQLPFVVKRISHSAEHFTQPKMHPGQGSVRDGV